MTTDPIVIASVARTPMGGFQGALTPLTAPEPGHPELKDHMFFDGLEDAYDPGRLMGTYAEKVAQQYGYSLTAATNHNKENRSEPTARVLLRLLVPLWLFRVGQDR